MLAAVWLAGQHRQLFEFLIPDGVISTTGGLVPGNSSFLLREIAPAAAVVLAFLLVFGLLGGWLSPAGCSPPISHHRRHTHGRKRVALPPNPATGPQRRVPRAR